jgi:hypothetical protein
VKGNGGQKGTLSATVRKELRVVISGDRSPLPFRIAKWIVFLSIARMLYGTRWFRAWVIGLPVAGLVTHLLYRHMTRAWTRPWGGWKDVEAGPGARLEAPVRRRRTWPPQSPTFGSGCLLAFVLLWSRFQSRKGGVDKDDRSSAGCGCCSRRPSCNKYCEAVDEKTRRREARSLAQGFCCRWPRKNLTT